MLSAATAALGRWWSGAFGSWEVLAQVVNILAWLLVTMVAFAMIYKIMPRVKIRWHDVWLGAAVTALLFTVGRFLIGLYIGKSGIASGFGAAGSLDRHSCMGVLLRSNISPGRRVHLGVCAHLRFDAKYRCPTKPEDPSAREIPSRNEDLEPAAYGPGIGYVPAPAPSRPLWVSVGAGAAFLLALNYVGARILKRR